MSVNRIQKLLFSEYCEFDDMVLLESPFAQTLRDGKGIRQVHLGLTPSKLILATDVLPSAKESTVLFQNGLDPEIETFELIAVYPVESVNLSIFHRRRRQSLKARFCNNRVLYFELGGFEKRKMFWNLWCEKIRFLNPDDPGSSNSETSVATSTSNSTLCLVNAKTGRSQSGKPQLWCRYGTKKHERPYSWNDKNLYIGKGFDDKECFSYSFKQIPEMDISDFIPNKFEHHDSYRLAKCSKSHTSKIQVTRSGNCYSVNRFGEGVYESCETSLFLPAENYIVSRKFSDISSTSTDLLYPLPPSLITDFEETAENSVRLWELAVEGTKNGRSRHRRRYAFSPQPFFFYGLGPWNVSSGERFSLQIKRALSAVGIRRQIAEPELRLPVSKRYLLASISKEDLHVDNNRKSSISLKPRTPIIYFWTPKYWYHPRSARDAYQELQRHLKNIKDYQQLVAKQNKKSNRLKGNFFRKKRIVKYENIECKSESDEFDDDNCQQENISSIDSTENVNCFLNARAILACFRFPREAQSTVNYEENSLHYLKRILRMEVALTAWDFNSTTIAHQLTIIDRDLFMKISPLELGVLVWQNSSKNAPNIGAMIAYSHRISCLITTEILRDDSEKIRARLISRFINAADKCHKISNFHSCKSILSGLQSPAIYRLHSTWSYVRRKHATRYQIFENLSKLHRDPRTPIYQAVFTKASKNCPCLPFLGDVLIRLLDKLPKHELSQYNIKEHRSSPRKENFELRKSIVNKRAKVKSSVKPQTIFRKFLCKLKINSSNTENGETENLSKGSLDSLSRENSVHDIEVMFTEPESIESDLLTSKSLVKYEDNRIKNLQETLDMLEKFQISASQFLYTKNELAREYLLKARYREEKENFINSFSVEIKNRI